MRLFSKYPPAKRGTIVVWGFLASHPFGGMTWQVLHHLVALRRLSFDVWYVEDSDRYLYDPITYCRTRSYEPNLEYLARHMDMVGLGDRWAYRPPEVSDTVLGALNAAGLAQLYLDADAAFNVCGAQELLPKHEHIRCRVLIETDPVTNQVAVANGNKQLMKELDAYDYLFTYGANLGAPDCLVPVERYNWRPTRPPVCVDWWGTDDVPLPAAALTTVTNWRHGDKKDAVWRGERWRWNKDMEFLRLKHLPSRSALPLELAIGSMGDEKEVMRACGWRIVNASDFTDPEAYRGYIWRSRGEFTASKEIVVRSRSGWFSDRSVCYLAAGRPVITQDTGFGNKVPTGEGLFAFSTEDEALDAIDQVSRDYERHSAAARAIAGEFFSAERLMCDVVRQVGLM